MCEHPQESRRQNPPKHGRSRRLPLAVIMSCPLLRRAISDSDIARHRFWFSLHVNNPRYSDLEVIVQIRAYIAWVIRMFQEGQ